MKSVTGFPTTYLLHQEIIGEAQRQILYTDKTIKEIANYLGYADYKYFIRLFTKITKLTPTKFRNAKANEQINLSNKVVVFKTNVITSEDATLILDGLNRLFPFHEINFDLEDCDRILRVKGIHLNAQDIIAYLEDYNHQCEELKF